ncbi:MAG: GrpB-like predicted nucleotidyltransferase (UPF0157 family) [Bradymonadia bacterium]|jgi:GrpB-like predicted nucleotidyltransferase (UPF0157 family)
MKTDAPIVIAPYDPHWPITFAVERDRLAEQLAPWLVGTIAHIGSTAVPGLAAKPVVDMMAPVSGLTESRPAIRDLVDTGWVHSEYRGDVMHWLCKPSPAHRTHHLHLVPFNGALWHDRITFRDALRADAALRDEYAALKSELAVRFSDDRDRYTAAKTPFIRRALRDHRSAT